MIFSPSVRQKITGSYILQPNPALSIFDLPLLKEQTWAKVVILADSRFITSETELSAKVFSRGQRERQRDTDLGSDAGQRVDYHGQEPGKAQVGLLESSVLDKATIDELYGHIPVYGRPGRHLEIGRQRK